VAITVEPQTFLTREEAAEALGYSVRSVDRLRDRGRLPAVQYLRRGRVRYRREDVEALLEPEAREPHPARPDELVWS
jgi:excisionase family DNA binding protein